MARDEVSPGRTERPEQAVVEVRGPRPVHAAGDAWSAAGPVQPVEVGGHPVLVIVLVDVRPLQDLLAAFTGGDAVLRLGAGNEPLVDRGRALAWLQAGE